MGKKKLEQLQKDAHSIYGNIEWNLGGIIGMAVVTANPKLISLSNAPMRIDIDGMSLDGFQCLGLSLLEKDRKPRADELFGLAKRALMCEALEIAADFLVRAVRIVNTDEDPYEIDSYFSVNIRELWNSKSSRAGSLVTKEDREFFEKCAVPLRNCVRHNNGRLLPHTEIKYSGNPRDKEIEVSFRWAEDDKANNQIKLSMSLAHDIFLTIWNIVEDGLSKALSEIDENAG